MTSINPGHWVSIAEELRPIIEEHVAGADRNGEPATEMMDAMAESGLLRLGLPQAYGGADVDPATLSGVVEALAAIDGSAGWLAAINIGGSLTMARVERHVAEEIYAHPKASTAGVFAPTGMAAQTESGFRLSGRWAFTSNSRHAAWYLCGSVLLADGEMVRSEAGHPVIRMLAFPAEQRRLHRTWDTLGLRGTGSHDIEVEAIDVPRARSLSLIDGDLIADEPLHRVPYFGLCSTLMASTALGIARNAVEHATKVVTKKTPLGSRKPALQRPHVQTMLVEARTGWESASAYLATCLDRCWVTAQGGGTDLGERADLRLAACQAVAASVRAVDVAHHVAGSASVYRPNPLERALRDVFTLRQHVMVGPSVQDVAARSRLGIAVDTTML